MEKQLKHISKFMSLVLRHQPQQIGLDLDKNGWADVEQLIKGINEKGISVDRHMIELVVSTNEKKRFAFNDDKTMIRASQGHSVEVDLGLVSAEPPALLYHGTDIETSAIILREGIKKMKRQHVHLSMDKETAINVGSRHGKPVVLTVLADAMRADGCLFFMAANAVWLTDFVDVKYIQR